MIINAISSIPVLPKPELGLLPAIHDAEVEDTVYEEGVAVLPAAAEAKGRVFRNQGDVPLVLPAYANWPVRDLSPGQLYGSDGRLYYRVTHKSGTTSYYPAHFERTIYTFSFTGRTLPVGGAFEFLRNFFFRLVANNTTAVWSVVFEIGEKVVQETPELELEIPVGLVEGEKIVTITDPQIGSLVYNMRVSGAGIDQPDGVTVRVSEIDVAAGTVELTRGARSSGAATLIFRAPIGPNLDGWKWLPPLVDEQLILTDSKSQNLFGVTVINWGTKYIELPQGGFVVDPNRNERGMEGLANIFGVQRNVLPECLPETDEFLLRVRIGQFDTENDVADPRGYAAYLIVDPEVDADKV